ncbi:CPBP family intramembrane glutamic endopeptidase [Leptothoe sp. PORK10 BA2]|uniref:CPBP family intramembrane glutamic endopeptidase n=1 Tax=Leptothoe sp. PORK10 BA2 TaxID=3110254 RepID=UPI002B20E764|nr:CPBP family intramembrane glutamic endopeptidase [Leptothoe sp. PORK10 BA2]MEA5464841.1 CPBP family intramembrane glutamic endopeptidase [Leptothoe sp. PORK10 BA2]
MVSKKMLFALLWFAGMMGILSLLWINLPIPEGDLPLPVIKLLNLISPTFLLSIAVLAGVNLAPQVGFSAPFAEAIASGSSQKLAVIQAQVIPGLLGGVLGAVVISVWSLVWKPSLPSDFLTKIDQLSKGTPLLTRLLYGGITEEIMLRWGLLTVLVWLLWRFLQKAEGTPNVKYVVLAITISALIFGLGHLPLVFALSPQVTTPLTIYIVAGNTLFGLIAGYLYWQKGLESAMIAHIVFHVVISNYKFKSYQLIQKLSTS